MSEELAKLKAGNTRFLASTEARKAPGELGLRAGRSRQQQPQYAILCCSDSRVCPEVIFDVAPGESFVVRSAGAAPGLEAIASLEYAITQLSVKLLLVLSHTDCGGIEALLQNRLATGASLTPAMQALMRTLEPVVISGACEKVTYQENARLTLDIVLEKSLVISEYWRQSQLMVASAVFQVDSGEVHWLPPHEFLSKETKRRAY